MDDTHLAEFRRRLVSFDTETDQVVPGLLAPPVACASVASLQAFEGVFLPPVVARRTFEKLLDGDEIVAGANLPYDLAVMLADAFERLPFDEYLDFARKLFAKLARGEAFDVQVSQALDAIARGHLFLDPRTGRTVRDPATGETGRYSLSIVVGLVLGRSDAKANDFWRRRYAILRRVPVADWPPEAKQYPRDDARNALEVAAAQGVEHLNIHDVPEQVRTAFALQLASCHGMRTDRAAIDAVESVAAGARAAGAGRWRELGFLEEGGGKDGKDKKESGVIKARLARAHGASGECPVCGGAGTFKSGKTKGQIICNRKNVESLPDGRPERDAEGAPCDGTGLDLRPALGTLTLAEKGGISAGRDLLYESGDEDLMGFSEYLEDEKILTTYVPFLRKGQDVPINPRANILVSSSRVSYDDVIMQLPCQGGVRECFAPRCGCVYCSTDYSSGELCTLAQVCLWSVGRSKMAQIINETRDPGALHSAFGARLANCTTAELKARIKAGDKIAYAMRQASKAANFGFPGGMGAPKFVLSKRKKYAAGVLQRTVAPDGTAYNGLRFCVMISGAPRCGRTMVTEWRGRPVSPVCRECVVAVEGLRSDWLNYYDEMPEYFDWVKAQIEANNEIVSFGSHTVRGNVSFPDAANHGFQNLLARAAKRAAWMVAREQHSEPSSPLFGTRTCGFFHDELLSEMPEPLAPKAGVRQAELMVEAGRQVVPDVVMVCEPALMRRWSKDGGSPIWLDDGVGGKRLGVWEPKAVSA